MKSATIIFSVLTVGVLIGISMMDWSSKPLPSNEAKALRNQPNIDLDIDMVLGAPGSPLQLTISSIYHIDYPIGNISYQDAKELISTVHFEPGIPLSLGDNHKGYRIVGTEHSYVDLYQASVQHGVLWDDTIPFGATIGSKVAKNLGLNVGDTFYSAHGLEDQSDIHEDKVFTVVGILNSSETVLDQLILTSLQSIWDIHNEEGDVIAPEDQEITAMLVKTRTPLGQLLLPKAAKNKNMQVAIPIFEVARWKRISDLARTFFK